MITLHSPGGVAINPNQASAVRVVRMNPSHGAGIYAANFAVRPEKLPRRGTWCAGVWPYLFRQRAGNGPDGAPEFVLAPAFMPPASVFLPKIMATTEGAWPVKVSVPGFG